MWMPLLFDHCGNDFVGSLSFIHPSVRKGLVLYRSSYHQANAEKVVVGEPKLILVAIPNLQDSLHFLPRCHHPSTLLYQPPQLPFTMPTTTTTTTKAAPSPIQQDLEALLAQKQKLRPPPPERALGNDNDPGMVGEARHQPGMKPPPPRPHMLNQEMAQHAALQYQKRESHIRQACAALDAGQQPVPPPAPPSAKSSCCVIL